MTRQRPRQGLLTAGQLAEMLSVEKSTIYEWARMGYIPHIRLGTGKKKPCVRFSREAIRQWLEEKEKEGRGTRIPTDRLN